MCCLKRAKKFVERRGWTQRQTLHKWANIKIMKMHDLPPQTMPWIWPSIGLANMARRCATPEPPPEPMRRLFPVFEHTSTPNTNMFMQASWRHCFHVKPALRHGRQKQPYIKATGMQGLCQKTRKHKQRSMFVFPACGGARPCVPCVLI